jgi:hypothetical protein
MDTNTFLKVKVLSNIHTTHCSHYSSPSLIALSSFVFLVRARLVRLSA